MKAIGARHSLLALLASTLLAVTAVAGEAIRFAPAPGLRLKKVLRITHELNVERMATLRDGIVISEDTATGLLSTWEHAEFLDEFRKIEGGRLREFLRTYTDLSSGGKASLVFAMGDSQRVVTQDAICFSPLHARTVAFTWVDEEGAYSRAYEHLDGEEALLADVDHDIDLLAVLPDREVQENDGWDVPVARAVSLLAPGGKLELVPKNLRPFARTMKVGAGGDLGEVLQNPSGKIRARFAGTREVEGVRCAVIQLDVEVKSDADRTDICREYVPQEEQRDPAKLEFASLSLEITGKGEVLWDLSAHHFRSYELDGTERVLVSMTKKMLQEGELKARASQESSFAGRIKLTLTAASPETSASATEKKAGD